MGKYASLIFVQVNKVWNNFKKRRYKIEIYLFTKAIGKMLFKSGK